MEFSTGKNLSAQLVHLKGRFDAQCADEIEKRLSIVIGNSTADILLDMAAVNYISSSGLKVLLNAAQKAKAKNLHLALCSLDPYVYEVLEVAGFLSIFEIHPDQEAALESMAAKRT